MCAHVCLQGSADGCPPRFHQVRPCSPGVRSDRTHAFSRTVWTARPFGLPPKYVGLLSLIPTATTPASSRAASPTLALQRGPAEAAWAVFTCSKSRAGGEAPSKTTVLQKTPRFCQLVGLVVPTGVGGTLGLGSAEPFGSVGRRAQAGWVVSRPAGQQLLPGLRGRLTGPPEPLRAVLPGHRDQPGLQPLEGLARAGLCEGQRGTVCPTSAQRGHWRGEARSGLKSSTCICLGCRKQTLRATTKSMKSESAGVASPWLCPGDHARHYPLIGSWTSARLGGSATTCIPRGGGPPPESPWMPQQAWERQP